MLINEVCKTTGLTKKAIVYYENQGLIELEKDTNGYRIYNEKDIKLLNEISLYRKLDISIKDILLILNSNDKKCELNKILVCKKKKEIELKVQKSYLEKLISSEFRGDEVDKLNKEIINNEKNNGEFIKNELERAFPNGMGTILKHIYSPFLNEPLDTIEKCNAWIKIVGFLDDIPDVNIPKLEMKYKYEINTKVEVDYENILDKVQDENSGKNLKSINSSLILKNQLTEIFNDVGFYEIFIPNMKILSKEFSQYYNSIEKLKEKLSDCTEIKYDKDK